MVIDGKYKMKNDGISAKSPEEYAKAYSDVVNQLLMKIIDKLLLIDR